MRHDVAQYTGGKLHKHYAEWANITTDFFILDTMKNGLSLEFQYFPSTSAPAQHPVSAQESEVIRIEIAKLLKKQVINLTSFDKGDFTRPKKDGTYRMILNLKRLNTFMEYNHFKMESIQVVIQVVRPGVYMTSIDLKDAFYSIGINPEHHKYLKFCFDNKIFGFTCMPNGYGPAMRVFTKTTKPIFANLRSRGHISVSFVDDSYLQGKTYEECLKNIQATISLLRRLGFTIHIEKSIIKPTQTITFLGFVINSNTMTLSLTTDKKRDIYHLCNDIITKGNKVVTIKTMATLIGKIVASFPAVTYSELYYRNLEANKKKLP